MFVVLIWWLWVFWICWWLNIWIFFEFCFNIFWFCDLSFWFASWFEFQLAFEIQFKYIPSWFCFHPLLKYMFYSLYVVCGNVYMFNLLLIDEILVWKLFWSHFKKISFDLLRYYKILLRLKFFGLLVMVGDGVILFIYFFNSLFLL